MDLLGTAAADRDGHASPRRRRCRTRPPARPMLARARRSPPSAVTIRATPRPDVQVDERPESSATCRTYQVRRYSSAAAACSAVGRTGTPSTVTRSKSGTLRSPCSPIDPGLDAAGRDAERPCEPCAQPQAVVDRVAEHPAPVDAGSRCSRVTSGSTGFVTTRTTPPQPGQAAVGELRRRSRAFFARYSSRERADHERRRGDRARRRRRRRHRPVAAVDGAAGRQLEHLLEVHHVRGDHLRPLVDEHDLVRRRASARG